MPHIILDVAAPVAERVDLPKLLKDLTHALAGIETFDIALIKARAVPLQVYSVAGQEPAALFAHLSINIMEGRTPAILDAVRDTLFAILQNGIRAGYSAEQCAISQEVREMDNHLYKK
jgi:5-carboxymethyl-2-hydroxymuconate isomerase